MATTDLIPLSPSVAEGEDFLELKAGPTTNQSEKMSKDSGAEQKAD